MLKVYHAWIASYAVQTSDSLFVVDGGHAEFGQFAIPDFYRHYVGAETIAGLFLTHYHNHHLAGLPGLIRFFAGHIRRLYTAGILPAPEDWPGEWADIGELERLLAEHGVDRQHVHSGMALRTRDPDLRFYAIHPHEDWLSIPGITHEHPNGRGGLMLLVTYGQFRLLFTGDVHVFADDAQRRRHWEERVFPQLEKVLGDTRVHVVQCPHHGHGQVHHDWWLDALDAQLYLLDGMPWNQKAMTDALIRRGSSFYSHFPVPGAAAVRYLELHAQQDGTFTLHPLDTNITLVAPAAMQAGTTAAVTAHAYGMSTQGHRYDAYPNWPDHYPVERMRLAWQLVDGPGTLMDQGDGRARLDASESGQVILKVFSLQEPSHRRQHVIQVF